MSSININNSYIDAVNWQQAGSFAPGHGVDVWRINVEEYLPHISRFRGVLNAEETVRANRYLQPADRERFIISRGALRYILAGYLNRPAAGIQFQLSANGKPAVVDAADLHFNLSDTAGCVLIAVAGSPVGIDVEFIKPDFAYRDIMTNYFSAEEIAYIGQKERLKRFFLLWTRKEAILKATGIGLTDHLREICALDGLHTMDGSFLSTQINWQLSSFGVYHNHIASLATHLPGGHRFFEFGLSEPIFQVIFDGT